MACTGTFSRWEDDTKAVHMRCDDCREGHTFKSDYFAKQWANRHGHMFVRTVGLA